MEATDAGKDVSAELVQRNVLQSAQATLGPLLRYSWDVHVARRLRQDAVQAAGGGGGGGGAVTTTASS